jgi:hypothetical protein
MLDQCNGENYAAFELLMNEAMRDVALEIRSVDLLDLASFIHAQNFANLGDIIHSAVELYFKPKALMFSYSADVNLDWFGCPMITLDLELHQSDVDVYFALKIDAFSSYIKLKHAALNQRPLCVVEDSDKFKSALNKARTLKTASNPNPLQWAQVFKPAVDHLKLISFR